ncbi:trypsin-like serine protease [Kocuria sp. M1R5S2]|uniref:trypsin-like serine protease n=1 Tax=Kocuria rhizosphaerae TaxID=3376285 RepID=UPI0037B6DA42
MRQALRGTAVSAAVQEEFGLVTVNGSCSGCLLRPGWVITAAHCVEQRDASGNFVPDPDRPGQNLLQSLAPMSIGAGWDVGDGSGTAQTRTVVRIETFRPYDVALLQLASPFVQTTLAPDQTRLVNADGQFPYFGSEGGMALTVFGRGIFQFATGSGDTAVPSQSDGQYRVGYARVTDATDPALYWYASQDGGFIAGGDSGGPSFAWTLSGYALVGVHALATVERAPGKDDTPTPWTWVSATPKAADAPLRPLREQLDAVMGPAPAKAPPQFIGVFPGTGPSRDDQLIQTFRTRAVKVAEKGFATGFPNFYFARYGLDHVGGTIMLRPGGVQWHTPPQAELGIPDTALGDFGERMRAVARYASAHGSPGGFPAFFDGDYGDGLRLGTYLLTPRAAEWRDVSLYHLNLRENQLGDVEARFRATQDYATANGFVGGFPNMFHARTSVFDPFRGGRREEIVCGTVLVRHEEAQWADILLFRDPA